VLFGDSNHPYRRDIATVMYVGRWRAGMQRFAGFPIMRYREKPGSAEILDRFLHWCVKTVCQLLSPTYIGCNGTYRPQMGLRSSPTGHDLTKLQPSVGPKCLKKTYENLDATGDGEMRCQEYAQYRGNASWL